MAADCYVSATGRDGVAYVNVKYFNLTKANPSGIWACQNNRHPVIPHNVVHDCYGSGINGQSVWSFLRNDTNALIKCL